MQGKTSHVRERNCSPRRLPSQTKPLNVDGEWASPLLTGWGMGQSSTDWMGNGPVPY